MLNSLGMTLHEARYVRPPVEVEALLLSLIAQRENRREEEMPERHRIPIVENHDDEAAPSWVEDLPTEE